jgi:hypothetical protein
VEFAIIFYYLRFETSLFVASYDSQGYSGGIPLHLHMGSEKNMLSHTVSYIITGRTEEVTQRISQFVLATSPLILTTSNFIFQWNPCGYSPYITSCLTRRWVCRLQLLLVLGSAVILKSESCWTHDHIPLYQIRDPPNLEGQVPVFISPGNRVAQLYPQVLGSLFVDF